MTSAAEDGFTRTYNYGASDSPTSVQTAITGAGGSQLRREEFSYGPEGLLETRVNDQAPKYPIADRLGTLTGEVSDRGEVSALPELDPFGLPVTEAPALPEIDQQSLGFLGGAGRESLADSELVKMGARMYDAETGAFVTRDPVTGEPSEPARRVAYAYAFSGPGRFVDLDGRSVLDGPRRVLDNVASGVQHWAVSKTNDLNANPFVKYVIAWPAGALSSLATCENQGATFWALVPGPGKLKSLGKAGGLAADALKGRRLLGEGGTQVTSKTIHTSPKGFRIDVENPAPGVRPGQLHVQDRAGGKYLYDFEKGQFVGAPRSLRKKLAGDPAVDRAIAHGRVVLNAGS